MKRDTERGKRTCVTYPEDLPALSRRGALSDAERRRLELCLASSPALRALNEIGCDFDRMGTSMPGDDALVRRVARNARQRCTRTAGAARARMRRLVSWGVGTALLIATALAAAGWWRRHVRPPPVASASAPLPASASGRGLPIAAPRISEAKAEVPAEPSPRTEPAGLAHGIASHRGPSAVVPSRPHPSEEPSGPSDLFSAANRARGRGDVSRALYLYDQLQGAHPSSAEAILSFALVGRLHLDRSEHAAALGSFDQYLRAAPSGPLGEEALRGKAVALHQLGRASEERAVWNELLRRYPGSVYAETARRRLGEDN
jgi:hypothetical protein